MAATENLPFRGRRTCICVITIVPLIEAEMKKLGLIKNTVDFFQMGYNKGGVSASAGTHDRGGCIDVAQYSDAHLAIWRKYGVRMQHRTPAQGFSHHGHGWPGGCPHMSPGANYQEAEWRAKRNGLRGRGPVTGPGWTNITWQQVVKQYGGATTVKDELDMATWITFATAKAQPLAEKAWTYLKINDAGDVSFGTGPAKIISGTLNLIVNGMVAGQVLQVQIVQDDIDGTKTTRVVTGAATDVVGSPGSSDQRTVPFTLNVAKASKGTRRVRACVLAPAKGVTVARAEVSYWKA